MKFLDYIKGNRKGKNARQVEYDAMSDPFLAEAIEGFDSVDGNHADSIARMQARVSALAVRSKKKSGAWKVAVAAVAVIAVVSGYFTLMNHRASMMVAQETENGAYINLYAPDEYIEQKRSELTEMRDKNMSLSNALNPVVNISNLHDVIKPNEVLIVYLPENHPQLKPSDLDELNREDLQNTRRIDNEAIGTDPTLMAQKVQQDHLAKVETRNKELAHAVGVISSAPALPSASIIRDEKHNVFTGRVVDQNNEPLIGASVVVKGTTKGTVTDVDGNFTLNVDDDNAKLVASYIGYESIEIPAPKDSNLITMKEDKQELSEVVVVGYAVEKKLSVTGAVSSISSESMKKPSAAPKSEPIGGMENYKKYIEDNKRKPASGECADKKGTVKLQFWISKEDGSPQDIHVVKSVCKDIDDEAIRLVKDGPRWSYGSSKIKLKIKF